MIEVTNPKFSEQELAWMQRAASCAKRNDSKAFWYRVSLYAAMCEEHGQTATDLVWPAVMDRIRKMEEE